MHFQINPQNSSNTNFEDFYFFASTNKSKEYETHPYDFRRRRRFIGRLQQDNKNRQRYEHFDIQRETGGGNVGHRLLRGAGRPNVVSHRHP